MRRIATVLLLSAWIPIYWQPPRGQTPSVRIKSSQNKKQQPKLRTGDTSDNERGTDTMPLIVETHSRPDSPEEAAKHKAVNDTKEYRDGWTFRLTILTSIFTGILTVVGVGGVYLAVGTLRALKKQVEVMEKDIAVTHRAYLSLGQLEEPRDDRAIFPINNIGHLPTLIVSVSVEVIGEYPDGKEVGSWTSGNVPFQDLSPAIPGSCVSPFQKRPRTAGTLLLALRSTTAPDSRMEIPLPTPFVLFACTPESVAYGCLHLHTQILSSLRGKPAPQTRKQIRTLP